MVSSKQEITNPQNLKLFNSYRVQTEVARQVVHHPTDSQAESAHLSTTLKDLYIRSLKDCFSSIVFISYFRNCD